MSFFVGFVHGYQWRGGSKQLHVKIEFVNTLQLEMPLSFQFSSKLTMSHDSELCSMNRTTWDFCTSWTRRKLWREGSVKIRRREEWLYIWLKTNLTCNKLQKDKRFESVILYSLCDLCSDTLLLLFLHVCSSYSLSLYNITLNLLACTVRLKAESDKEKREQAKLSQLLKPSERIWWVNLKAVKWVWSFSCIVSQRTCHCWSAGSVMCLNGGSCTVLVILIEQVYTKSLIER